jgi:hypothetical protein
MNKYFINVAIFVLLVISCKNSHIKTEYPTADLSSEEVTEPNEGAIDSLAFQKLISLTDSTTKNDMLSDSLSFLIIPLDAVCPHCRDKAIKALFENKNKLAKEHYVIITAASYKGINGFFAEKNLKTPEIKGKVFLDGESEAFKGNLIFMHPTVYYTHNKQVFEKIISYPTNIDKTLDDFFKNKRN